MAVYYIFLQLIAIVATLNLYTEALTSIRGYCTSLRHTVAVNANPITSDGSKYRSDITEEEAFLWFDEAMVSNELILVGDGF